MHAVWFSAPGAPEVLHWSEYADPSPGPGEVVLAVHATGVNYADLLQREGHYPPPAGCQPHPRLGVCRDHYRSRAGRYFMVCG